MLSEAKARGDLLAKAWGRRVMWPGPPRQRRPQNSSLAPGLEATFLPRLGLETETCWGWSGKAPLPEAPRGGQEESVFLFRVDSSLQRKS